MGLVPPSDFDLGHNFVLAHAGCNNDKSDTLAAVPHLERWCQRKDDLGRDLASEFGQHEVPHDLGSSLRVASWSYSQAEAACSILWVATKEDPMIGTRNSVAPMWALQGTRSE